MIMQTARPVSDSKAQAQEQATQRVTDRIRRRTEASLAYHRLNPERIPDRLEELEQEWDIERALTTAASGATLASLLFTILRGAKWLFLGLGAQAFVMQHALHGRCGPSDLLRNLGLRTRDEIEQEKFELQRMLDDAGGPDEQTGGEATEQAQSEESGRAKRSAGSSSSTSTSFDASRAEQT
jgi:hypothetical protein